MKITKYLIGGLAALALVGCKDKMRELNSNPNTIGETDPRYMFLNATQNLDNTRGSIENATKDAGVRAQYFVYYTGASAGKYCNTNGQYSSFSTIGNYYEWLYGVGYKMTLLQDYIDNNITDPVQQQRYQDLRAIAGIVKVYEAFRVFQNYGAAVYSEAFKAITEGITLPKYDVFSNEVYESLDDELAGYISVLAAPANENTIELGIYDPIYGYVVNPAAGAPTELGNYDQQRTMWKKFGNSYRLYMAWIMQDVDPTRFSKVLSETQTSGWFESAADGAFAYVNGFNSNGGQYNSDGSSDISTLYAMSDNFIAYLKYLDDPRLPLLARANDLYAANTGLQWIQNFFPDSLQKRSVYNEDTKTWSEQLWDYDKVFNYVADPKLAYQGQSPNPYDYDKSNPGKFWGQRTFTFTFYQKTTPSAVVNADGSWTITGLDGQTCLIAEADTSITLSMASRPQGRYFVAGGGKNFGDNAGESGQNGRDGSVDNNSSLFFRQPLYTYPEFCFMMAYLTNGGVNTGKSADQWYTEAVTGAMEELQGDAIRSQVQVATNPQHTYAYNNGTTTVTYTVNPEIVGVNDNGVYDISGQIAAYVANHSLSSAADKVEAIVGQMWIYAYNQPIKMWDWWRKTGYPKIVKVAAPANRPAGLYWVEPYTTSEEVLTWPRRSSLPQPQAANNANYNAARDELLTQPNYGSNYNTTTGRIYWDTQGLQ